MGRERGGSLQIGDTDRLKMIEPRDSIISDIDESLKELIEKFDTEMSDDP